METALRAGVAVYNAGEYHAAHDAWEDRWLDLASGTDDELLLHGLIQFTAAVHHARNRNWSGATGLAESGRAYLAELPADYRGVNVDAVRSYLGELGADPELIERRPPVALELDGRALGPGDLDFASTCVAAAVLAEEDGHEDVLDPAIEYARTDVDDRPGSQFVTFVFDYVREPESRETIVQRLGEHVQRRQSRDADVEGLFD